METKSLVKPNSALKLVNRKGWFLVVLDGVVVNRSMSLIAGQLFAQGVRREIQAKRGFRKSVAA